MLRPGRFLYSISNLGRYNSRGATYSTEPKQQKIKVNDCNINYLKVGRGEHTVLCMPGILGMIGNFRPQVEGFDREKFTLVVWEPPGYGKSRPPEKKFDPDLFERDAHVAYAFMKALDIPRYSVLGWSGGTANALILTAKYPEVVKKLVLIAGFSHILPHELANYKRAGETWLESMNESVAAIYGAELFAKYCAEWPRGMERIFKERGGNVCAELLKDIKCPTFLLHGQKDKIIDSKHISHLHTHIKGSRTHLYPNGDHDIHFEYTEDFNRRVQEFLLLP